jgi:hypothetical protein
MPGFDGGVHIGGGHGNPLMINPQFLTAGFERVRRQLRAIVGSDRGRLAASFGAPPVYGWGQGPRGVNGPVR